MGTLAFELLLIAGALGLLGGGIYKAIKVGASALTRLHREHAEWEVKTVPLDAHRIVVGIEREGSTAQQIETIQTDDEDFEDKLYLAQSRARNVALALNSGR